MLLNLQPLNLQLLHLQSLHLIRLHLNCIQSACLFLFRYRVTSFRAALLDCGRVRLRCKGVVLEPARFIHIPATTRATMAHLGLPLTVEIGDEVYDLSPQEMPGEVQWRVAMLRWLVRKIFHYLASLPQDQWIQRLLVVERELMTKTGLHMHEARAVAEGALLSIHDLSPSEIEVIARKAVYFESLIKYEGEKLEKRYAKIVRKHAHRVSGHDAVSGSDLNKREALSEK